MAAAMVTLSLSTTIRALVFMVVVFLLFAMTVPFGSPLVHQSLDGS